MSGRRDRITRRTVLGAGASSVVTPAAARSLMHVEGGQTPIAQQSIIGLTLSNNTFFARAS